LEGLTKMPTADEIQRIAAAMNALRPDWRPSSLVTFLTKHHIGRSYRDLAIAGVVVASDPTTKTPHLLNGHGSWWVAAQAVMGSAAVIGVPAPGAPRCEVYGHEHEVATHCRACKLDAAETGRWPDGTRHHQATRTTPPVDPAMRAANAHGSNA
jgi:hypothetical protein